MTKRSQQQINYTLATHAIEKLTPSKTALHLCEQVTNGKMNADTAVTAILQQYGLRKASING